MKQKNQTRNLKIISMKSIIKMFLSKFFIGLTILSLCNLNVIAQTVSNFSTGVTFTQHSLDSWGNDAAVERGKNLLNSSTTIVNQHLMGFGALNPEPFEDQYDFSTIDARIGKINGSGKDVPAIVLTACCSPDWMKGGNQGETVWTPIEWFEKAPLPEHYADYTELVVELVKRDEFSNIKYLQVWNEMKGFWDASQDRWNHEGYTKLYNMIWNKVKDIRPDIKIGGPYVVLNSFGEAGFKTTNKGSGDWGYFDKRDIAVVEYWLKNKAGADFITVDGKIKNRDNIHPVDQFERTEKFADFANWLRNLDNQEYPGAETLPLWWAEWYTIPDNPNASQEEKNALMATGLIKMIKSGAATALLWGPQGNQNGDMFPLGLFSDTRNANGGQPTLFYKTQQYIYNEFGEGRSLLEISSTNNKVEILGSQAKSLLVNKTDTNQDVNIRGTVFTLEPFEVKLVDTPLEEINDCNLISNGNFSRNTNNWINWNCDAQVSEGSCTISNIEGINNPWDAALAQGDFTIENGKTYEISFDAIALKNNRAFNLKVGLSEDPFTNFYYKEIPLTTTREWVSRTFTMREPTSTKARLEFHIGASDTGIRIDNVVVKPVEDCSENCNQVKNGNFSEGLQNWSVQQFEASNVGNGLYVNIPETPENFWDIALKQSGFTFEQGKQYQVSFKAKPEDDKTIQVKAGKSGATYLFKAVDLTATQPYHQFNFTMDEATASDVLFEFFFGDSNINLELSDISVEETGCANQLRENIIKTDFELFPNPVNDQLNIFLDITDNLNTAFIRLFDLSGRIIFDEQKNLSTSNQFNLDVRTVPPGIYVIQINMGTHTLKQKLVKH